MFLPEKRLAWEEKVDIEIQSSLIICALSILYMAVNRNL